MNRSDRDLLDQGIDILKRDGAYLDERRWDEWLALYREDCQYWVPAWVDPQTLGSDPQRALSHLYFDSRGGLEDRVMRVTHGHSPASTPLPRTAHLIGNVLPAGELRDDSMRLRSTWHCDVFYPRDSSTARFFGLAEIDLRRDASAWRIARKKIVLQNDYIPTTLDYYCL